MHKYLAGLVAGAIAVCAGYALASRNSSGTYTLATSAVTSNQTIGSALWNNTFNDLASEMTNSLSRDGMGGMRASLRGVDGTVAAPAVSFTSEPGSGLYRIGAGDLGWAISGGKKLELTSALFTVTPDFAVGTSKFLVTAATGNAATTGQITVDSAGTNSGTIGSNAILFGSTSGGEGIGSKRTATGNQFGLDFYTNSTARIQIGNAGTVTVSTPLVIGATGTAISARYRGTTSWTPGSVAASTSTVKAITVTGAAAGADCRVTPPNAVGAFTSWCVVTADTCTVTIYNTLASGPSSGASGTWSCVVENP